MSRTNMTTPSTNDHLRALLFPVDGCVAALPIDPRDVLAGLYRAIQCSTVDVVALYRGIDLWCDDEGFWKAPVRPNRVWLVHRCTSLHPQHLVGHVVALGRTDDGTARSLSVDEAQLAIESVLAIPPSLGEAGAWRPARRQLAAWLERGVDWLS